MRVSYEVAVAMWGGSGEGGLFTSPGGALEMKEERAAVRDMAAVVGYGTPGLGVGRRVAKLQLCTGEVAGASQSAGTKWGCRDQSSPSQM